MRGDWMSEEFPAADSSQAGRMRCEGFKRPSTATRALIAGFVLLLLAGRGHGQPPGDTAVQAFGVPDAELSSPLTFIIYGDMRFTDPAETTAAAPGPRVALVNQIASEAPDAVLLTGDIPWHGTLQDYGVYAEETAIWRERHLRIYPVLGNHEFQLCAEAECLEDWWQTFPVLRGRRWYELALGSQVRFFALDSNSPLRPGSPQRLWLEQEVQALPREVRFVILALHHPPVADLALLITRANERSLATYLSSIAPRSAARYIVAAGHVHNYERFEKNGVVYLVSGGGGAKPLKVHHERADFYRQNTFPNFHYIRFRLQGDRLTAQMVRLEDWDAPMPHTWAVKDQFEVVAKAP
jgi:acid phosphatase type 7